MKTFFLTFGLLVSTLNFSQKIIINVLERQEMICFRKTTLDSVLFYPDSVGYVDSTHTTFKINLNKKTSKYFVDKKKISVLPIKYEYLNNNILKVNIIQEDLNYGLLINKKEKSVLWFWFADYKTTTKKFIKYNIKNMK